MKSLLKITTCAVALAAVAGTAAPKYPFKSYTYPHGTVIKYGDDSMIKDHYNKWKKAWYDASQGWIYAPEGTCSTVSEAIAYGMMIAVYMDDGSNGAKDMFDKLYNTWKSNGGNGAGMNWRVGCSGGTGSASDADFDAALALIMASKQWSNDSYLNDAKAIISWMSSNDINGTKIKPGSQWNDAFNPSYATLANFRVFSAVGGSGDWNGVATWGANEIKACQNQSTGLVPDWCTWDGHQPTKTSASVQQSEAAGFFDDAARTPWRTAWDYYWFGTASSKAFNATITKWLYSEAPVASEINSGYYVDGKAEKSTKRNFASSTFSGGLGLAASSDETDVGEKYLGTVYSYLASKTACARAQNCGEGDNPGEKYYPSTLNLLYLLLITGHMPNFYDMTGYTEFTPDPGLAPSIGAIDGQQMAKGDSTVGISGFWNWGAYHDKFGIGTEMTPDSGTSPLFYKSDLDMVVAEASMNIGPEPEWTQEAADAGLLKYPSAGIAMSFLSNDKKGVDLTALNIKYVRVTMKASGPIRMAILNERNNENEAKKVKNAGAGAEPGIYVKNSSDFTAQIFDLTPKDLGFVGTSDAGIDVLDWVDSLAVPKGSEIIKCVTGLKWEVKQKEGGIGELTIKSIEFLDASQNVVDPVKITGMANVGTKPSGNFVVTSSSTIGGSSSSGSVSIAMADALSTIKVHTSGLQVQILNAKIGSSYAIMSVQGKVVASGKITSASHAVTLPNKGVFLVKVNGDIRPVSVK